MENIVNFIISNFEHLVLIVTSIITAASVIVKLTPDETDNVLLEKVISVCKLIGLYK